MKVGLVLSGGMGKGAFQIGALEAVCEYFSSGEIQFVSGASIGAVNAYAFSTEQLPFAKQRWVEGSDRNKGLLLRAFKNKVIDSVIEELTEVPLPSDMNFFVPLFNFKNQMFSYFDLCALPKAERAKYLRAAVAFPVLSRAVEIDGLHFYDGALVDNIPVEPLKDKGIDCVICMYFDHYHYVFENREFDDKIVKITFDDTLLESVVLSKERTESMLQKGYQSAKSVLEYVFREGKDDLEKIYRQIQSLGALHKQTEIRMTGDVVFNNLTKVIKKYGVKNILK